MPSQGAVLVALTSRLLPLPPILALTTDLSCQAVPQPLSLPTTLIILICLMNRRDKSQVRVFNATHINALCPIPDQVPILHSLLTVDTLELVPTLGSEGGRVQHQQLAGSTGALAQGVMALVASWPVQLPPAPTPHHLQGLLW